MSEYIGFNHQNTLPGDTYGGCEQNYKFKTKWKVRIFIGNSMCADGAVQISYLINLNFLV